VCGIWCGGQKDKADRAFSGDHADSIPSGIHRAMGFGVTLYPVAVVPAEGARGVGASIGGQRCNDCRLFCHCVCGAEWFLGAHWNVAVSGNCGAAAGAPACCEEVAVSSKLGTPLAPKRVAWVWFAVAAGLTVIEAEAEPLLQLYVPPPEAVSVADCPAQIVAEVAEGVGRGLTFTVMLVESLQLPLYTHTE